MTWPSGPRSMRRRPLVLLDVDGVLADFVGAYLDALEKVTGRRRERDEIRTWDIVKALDLAPADAEEVARIVGQPDFCYDLKLIEGAAEGVAALRKIADIHVVTAPWPSRHWPGERVDWLLDALGIERLDITLTTRKDLVRGDVLLDDRFEHLLEWTRANQDSLGILWDTPHNRNLDEDFAKHGGNSFSPSGVWVTPEIVRVTDWASVHRIVEANRI